MKKKRIYDVDNEPELEKKEQRNKMIKWIIIIGILIIVGGILWARYISTRGLRIKEYAIETENITEEYDGFKIVHFADLHYGSTIRLKELKKLVQEINKLKPDVVVFTGDLTEPGSKISNNEIEKVIKELSNIDPAIETMAVIGNHDYETKYWDKIVPKLDWTVLDNTYHYVYKDSQTPIVFVGIDDKLKGKPDYENAFSYTNETEENLYTIVLLHEPDQVLDMKSYNYNLVLAGHSHLGQVRLPGVGAIYVPTGSKTYYDEHYKLDKADLYINGGVGTSTLKLRFFNKPSINLYRFYKK